MRVYIWSTRTGKALEEYRAQPVGVELPHESEIAKSFGDAPDGFRLEGGGLSPDASRLIVLGRDVRVFDIATGKQIGELPRTTGIQARPAISSDNVFTLALASLREPPEAAQLPPGATVVRQQSVELRQLSDGKLVSTIAVDEGGSAAAVFSDDGRRAAICVGHKAPRVLVLSVPELKEIARIGELAGRPQAVAFSHSGKMLAVSNSDTTVVVYDLEKVTMQQQKPTKRE
jgi:WD40 repeat protein